MPEDKKNRLEDREEEKVLRKQMTQFDLELKRLYEAIKKGIPPATLAEPLADTGNKKRELERLLHEITETKSPLSKLVLDDDAVSGIVNETHRLLKESQLVELKPLIQNIIGRIELDGHSATIWYSISPEPNSAEYMRPRGDSNPRSPP